MTTARQAVSHRGVKCGVATLAVWLSIVVTGCHAIDLYTPSLQTPLPPGLEPPRELSRVSLPAYRIEPPDILRIEVVKLVPKPPYRIETYDVLRIQVTGTLSDQPIGDFYLVEGDGIVNLGPAYGTVRVAGMTVDEATLEIKQQLNEVLLEPSVSVQLARSAGVEQITGEYLVRSDGVVNLRRCGMVHVAGKTVTEARLAVEEHLARYFDSPQVSVEVVGYNSAVFYVVVAAAQLGEYVFRLPITGNETVLDAMSQIGGLTGVSSKTMWVARAAPQALGAEQVLPVDWLAIARGGLTDTNYQLLPGDRLYIVDDKLNRAIYNVAKVATPTERLLQLSVLGTSTVSAMQQTGRSFQQQQPTQ